METAGRGERERWFKVIFTAAYSLTKFRSMSRQSVCVWREREREGTNERTNDFLLTRVKE